jgi:hypothetical protein
LRDVFARFLAADIQHLAQYRVGLRLAIEPRYRSPFAVDHDSLD